MKAALIAWLVITALLYLVALWWSWDETLSDKRRSIKTPAWHAIVLGLNAVLAIVIMFGMAKPLAYMKYLFS